MNNPLIMSDEELDRLAELYQANPILQRQHVSFEMFLYNPMELLLKASQLQLDEIKADMAESHDAFLALLPKQQAVRDRIYAQDASPDNVEHIHATGPRQIQWQDNGHLVEPLTHCAHPKRRLRRCAHRSKG